jgi:predicted Zn finger-like uncharacterized protein
MYTQCPDCRSVFEISSEHLGAAGGMVRCGVCDTTFNALRRLSETAPVSQADATDDNTSPESGTLTDRPTTDNGAVDDESATEAPVEFADSEETSEVSALVSALLDDAEEELADAEDVADDHSLAAGNETKPTMTMKSQPLLKTRKTSWRTSRPVNMTAILTILRTHART